MSMEEEIAPMFGTQPPPTNLTTIPVDSQKDLLPAVIPKLSAREDKKHLLTIEKLREPENTLSRQDLDLIIFLRKKYGQLTEELI